MNDSVKIKLLVLTPTMQCGGSEKFVSLVCNHIDTNRFEVCLLVINNARPFYTCTNPDVQVIDLQKSRVLFSLAAIRSVVKSFKPDIIFSTANHLNLYLAIFRNTFDARIKFVAREASIVSISTRHAKMPALYNRLIKKYYHRFDEIICQSRYMQQDLVTNYHIAMDKTRVIHNAVEAFTIPEPAPVAPGNDRVYTFITVARLSVEKGIERLVHAVGLLTTNYKLYVIGEGDKRPALQQLIDELQLNDKVLLVGERSRPFAGMENADLFLFGSYYDGFPNVLLEAGAHGIPVVAFNVPGGIAEIVTPENGILVEDNDIIAFARAVKEALETNFNREAIIATTKKRFALSRTMSEIENLFLEPRGNK